MVLPLLLCLPWHAVLFYEGLVNGRSDELCGHNWHPIELAETHDQGWKSQCSIGLFWAHWVSWRCDPYKLLGHIDTNLGQDGIDQLTFRQGKIRIMIAGEDVVEKQCHPDLCQGGHASAHDPHPSSRHTSWEVLSRNAQQLTYGLLIKS
ncbi:hypothetical protein GmHk_19G054904 [Glycine max]|nr:hypothetical protein GmHk_19G054904 [Glycine max]